MESTQAEKDAKAFVRFVNASAKAWTDGNNRGRDDDGYRFYMGLHEARGKDAEEVAARYGFKIDWPGLYPTLHRADLGEFYDTGTVSAVSRLFATAQGGAR